MVSFSRHDSVVLLHGLYSIIIDDITYSVIIHTYIRNIHNIRMYVYTYLQCKYTYICNIRMYVYMYCEVCLIPSTMGLGRVFGLGGCQITE